MVDLEPVEINYGMKNKNEPGMFQVFLFHRHDGILPVKLLIRNVLGGICITFKKLCIIFQKLLSILYDNEKKNLMMGIDKYYSCCIQLLIKVQFDIINPNRPAVSRRIRNE